MLYILYVIYLYLCMCVHVWLCTCMHVDVPVHVCKYVPVHIHACVCLCMIMNVCVFVLCSLMCLILCMCACEHAFTYLLGVLRIVLRVLFITKRQKLYYWATLAWLNASYSGVCLRSTSLWGKPESYRNEKRSVLGLWAKIIITIIHHHINRE